MGQIDIREYIPGDRFISRKELAQKTGLRDRTIRHLIEMARHRGARIISNTGCGGYRLTDDDREWSEFVKAEARRAIRTFKTVYTVQGQISIEDLLREEA